MTEAASALFQPIELPCGAVLANRIAKAAMSDGLGDGKGNPTPAQIRLYERWAEGGIGLSIIGEVQGDAHHAEKPGNLVLGERSNIAALRDLTRRGSTGHTQLWPQLGHAGAMTHPPIGTPKGPSALTLPGLTSAALSKAEIADLPGSFARTARTARDVGFGGVEIHAAHGFLLSQFLSPLFNLRTDAYGGTIQNRVRLLLEVIEAVRAAVGPSFPIGVKLNATDQLEGGLSPEDALLVIAILDKTSVDLIDISGGTYFPGAKSSSDATGSGAYFLSFAEAARDRTAIPLMLTGGFKTQRSALDAIAGGAVDIVGLARALVLEPALPRRWQEEPGFDVTYPRFTDPPEGGITAWYTMRLTELGEDREGPFASLRESISNYHARDVARESLWRDWFAG